MRTTLFENQVGSGLKKEISQTGSEKSSLIARTLYNNLHSRSKFTNDFIHSY